MAGGSSLDPDNVPAISGGSVQRRQRGSDLGSMGPSDTTDTGSDVAGAPGYTGEVLETSTDSTRTGEDTAVDESLETDRDRGADQVVGVGEAGLGGGLDQAEEAQLGITDEELSGEADDVIRDQNPERVPFESERDRR